MQSVSALHEFFAIRGIRVFVFYFITKGIKMALQELSIQEIEHVAGGAFSPSIATYGIGVITAAGVGFGFFGPAGSIGAAAAYTVGFGGTRFLQFMLK